MLYSFFGFAVATFFGIGATATGLDAVDRFIFGLLAISISGLFDFTTKQIMKKLAQHG